MEDAILNSSQETCRLFATSILLVAAHQHAFPDVHAGSGLLRAPVLRVAGVAVNISRAARTRMIFDA
jgi:hypothetical protein